ncbi:hypothetical protein T265_01852 [Opisthorchis viverrini]|uniref:Uncharacterized protein n=1 Tax=Opisthorchis viverrini TaxID=6198 RepID=A0A075AIR2_OPIVI|nr:hypothetical protein T265_01852 [Opisthorchis viverrini]KER32079.1 hypothetical protein T265_01852 [Opisthorchis viverrini]
MSHPGTMKQSQVAAEQTVDKHRRVNIGGNLNGRKIYKPIGKGKILREFRNRVNNSILELPFLPPPTV